MRKILNDFAKNKPLKIVVGLVSFFFNLALLISGITFMAISAGSIGPGGIEIVLDGVGKVTSLNGHGVVFFFGFLMTIAPITIGLKALTEVLLHEKDKDDKPIEGFWKTAWHTIQHHAPLL